MAIEGWSRRPTLHRDGDGTTRPIPPREVIPVFGGYPDEFWSGRREELPPDPEGVYQFHVAPNGAPPPAFCRGSTDKPNNEVKLSHYPKFTAELGGGIAGRLPTAEPLIGEDDIAPMPLVQLGFGLSTLLGYYMFQGGINPQGKVDNSSGIASYGLSERSPRQGRTTFRRHCANSDK